MAMAKDSQASKVARRPAAVAVATDAQKQAQRLTQFSKTKLCKFELIGMCAKGPACPFAHSQGEVQPLPDLRNTKLCAVMLWSGKCTKEGCTFAHRREDLRSTSAFQKSKLHRVEQVGGHGAERARYSAGPQPKQFKSAQDYPMEFPPGFGWSLDVEPSMAGGIPSEMESLDVPVFSSSSLPPADPRRVSVHASSRVPGSGWSPSEPAYVPLPGGLAPKFIEGPWRAMPCFAATELQGNWTSESTLCTLGDQSDSLTAATVAGGEQTPPSFTEGRVASAFALPKAGTLPVPLALRM